MSRRRLTDSERLARGLARAWRVPQRRRRYALARRFMAARLALRRRRATDHDELFLAPNLEALLQGSL